MRGKTNAAVGGKAEFVSVNWNGSFTMPGSYAYYIGRDGLVSSAINNFHGPIEVMKNSLLFFSDNSFVEESNNIPLIAGGISSNEDYALFHVKGSGNIEFAI